MSDLDLMALLAKQVGNLQRRIADVAKMEGPAGRDGRDGVDGRDGKDGQVGPAGRDGKDGADGVRGEVGPRGPKGEPGPQGEPGEKGDKPNHQWSGTKLRFEKSDGTWGKYVDLKGPKGDPGKSGGGGWGGGGPTFNPSLLPAADDALPEEFMVRQGGQWVRASLSQMRVWFPGGGFDSDFDGGSASSVFLSNEIVDGGNANG